MFPTTRLPPIQSIASHSRQSLADTLEYLHGLYHPPVRGSRRRRQSSQSSADKGTVSSAAQYAHLDTFERNYTIMWLTSLISHLHRNPACNAEALIQQAASLLALCSGTSAAGTFHRDFVFTSSYDPSCSIALHIKDIPLNNHDYASVGAQTWGGSCVLSESIVDEPWKFGLCSAPKAMLTSQPVPSSLATPDSETIPRCHPLRVLELGAGTGLVSLTIGKLLHSLLTARRSPTFNSFTVVSSRLSPSVSNLTINAMDKLNPMSSSVTVISTDHYSPVLKNLEDNIQANFPSPDQLGSVSIASHFLDWASFSSMYASHNSPVSPKPFNEPFDLIFGADIIYELEHASWIKSCLSILLRKPTTTAEPTVLVDGDAQVESPAFHLIIPLRPTHVKESQTVELTFPFSNSFNEISGCDVPTGYVHGSDNLELCILSKEVTVCETEDRGTMSNEDDGVVYLYYKIGWSISRQI
ncbi:hypothetical protein APHAL10511_000327 [Amanita phalloides]|nr:hypothetical protein APHAL10511_000327 [Amanita phalloides]